MEYQKAIEILLKLLDKHPFDAEEKEAVMTAIGVLGWGSLAKSKIKALKAKRDKSIEWKHSP
jgi:DNA-binding SARP family transcriptional activator